jgi:hypothetical protein
MTRGRATTIDLIGPGWAGHILAALGLKIFNSLCVPIVYQLYEAISKEENALPEAALLLAQMSHQARKASRLNLTTPALTLVGCGWA